MTSEHDQITTTALASLQTSGPTSNDMMTQLEIESAQFWLTFSAYWSVSIFTDL